MPVLNNVGQTAFQAVLNGTDVDSTNGFGIWSEGSVGLALVARSRKPGPRCAQRRVFRRRLDVTRLGSPILNDAGQTAFFAGLTGSGVVAHVDDQGIWSEGSGSLALVARTGSQAPGLPSGVNFSYLDFGPLALNNAGQTAFVASFTGGYGIWSEGSGSLALVASGGAKPPARQTA